MKSLILASTSDYRRELLARLGLPFEIRAPGIDETPLPHDTPAGLASRLAECKARAIPDASAVIVGSDQVAALDGRILGKPGDPATARRQLADCQGRTVRFFTACAVLEQGSGRLQSHLDETSVRFRQRSAAEIETYLEREPAFDCAGGFKAEGLGISLFEAIESCDPTALIGLPLIWLTGALANAGLDPLT